MDSTDARAARAAGAGCVVGLIWFVGRRFGARASAQRSSREHDRHAGRPAVRRPALGRRGRRGRAAAGCSSGTATSRSRLLTELGPGRRPAARAAPTRPRRPRPRAAPPGRRAARAPAAASPRRSDRADARRRAVPPRCGAARASPAGAVAGPRCTARSSRPRRGGTPSAPCRTGRCAGHDLRAPRRPTLPTVPTAPALGDTVTRRRQRRQRHPEQLDRRPARDHAAVGGARAAADDDELHQDLRRPVAHPQRAGPAGRAAQPGARRPGAVPQRCSSWRRCSAT